MLIYGKCMHIFNTFNHIIVFVTYFAYITASRHLTRNISYIRLCFNIITDCV